jgi:chemotaxis family two-component system sensor kinase Cph1
LKHDSAQNESQSAPLEESAEELYEFAPCGYLTTTIDGRIIKVNRTLADWLGYTREELTTGKRFPDLLSVGGKIFYDTHLSLLLRMQRSVDEIALDLVCKNGVSIPALINSRQKRDPNDQPLLNRFTIYNATERRMYERQLLAARDLFQTTLSSIGDGVIATDATGVVTFINPVAASLSGWPEKTALGRMIDEVLRLVREDNDEAIENPLTQALRSGQTVGLENHTVLVAKDGRRIVVDDSASPIRDENGTMTGAVLVFRDVSERRRVQRALDEARIELEKAAAELKQSNEDLSQFAYIASHDLRSPLNTVTTLTQLLARNYGDKLGEGNEILRHVTDATRRMAKLIEDLLTYATATTKGGHTRELVDANIQLAAAVENLEAAIADAGAEITHEDLPAIAVDGTSLVQIFQNLIGNAIRYRSAEAPRIHIAARAVDDEWLFCCRDNGIGIAPQYHAQIFEPFKRLHGVELPGSGIGLALCKKIIERYKGRVWVESNQDEGATFYFSVPARFSETVS